MLSWTKLTTGALCAFALLCASPLAAAVKTVHKNRPGASSHHAKSAAPASHLKASNSRASSATARATARNSSKRARPNSAALRNPRRGKVQVVAVKAKVRGQQAIDQARTMEIQQALIREHYLDGEATGEWNQATRDALVRFQNDNHWQTRVLPDARALIKLGLGPRQQNLLNPESAAMAPPYQSGIEKSAPGGSN
jgi:hypothetical protein